MKYFKVHYLVIGGRKILADAIYVYASEKQLPQLNDRITHIRTKHYPDQFNIEILFKKRPSEITQEEYKQNLVLGHGS